ncbi:MAG: peptide/nickel transport system permease protein [Thermomicrobiales bacterium]|jgi:peptide/nickel transport system permease protein|nr:peptide/nickel transport system permease protein [Thermomicrobiales bacterium]
MQRFVLQRLIISVPVLIGVTLLAFVLVNLAPGDPVSAMISPAERSELGPEWVELRKEQLGLNDPIVVRYGIWLREIATGNLGYSLISGESIAGQIGARVGPTVLLMGTVLIVALLLGVPLGILSAVRQYSVLDYVATVFGFLTISTPTFFLGLGLMYIIAVRLRWLPTSGMRTLGVPESAGDLFKHMVLPVTVLALAHTPLIMRFARSTMLEVIRQDYVTTARAKGLAERVILIRHAFRNALIPLITVVGMGLPELFSGAVITETIFQWPGMGLLTVRAVHARDYPLILGAIMVTATAVLISNLIADLLYAAADPRIKYE